jgi:hypothetical protein
MKSQGSECTLKIIRFESEARSFRAIDFLAQSLQSMTLLMICIAIYREDIIVIVVLVIGLSR